MERLTLEGVHDDPATARWLDEVTAKPADGSEQIVVLRRCVVGPLACRALCSLVGSSKLVSLKMDTCSVAIPGGAGLMKAIGCSPALRSLEVESCDGIDLVAAEALREALVSNVTLLSVTGSFGAGADVIASLADSLKQNAMVDAVRQGTDSKIALMRRGLGPDLPASLYLVGANLVRLDASNNALTELSTKLSALSGLTELVLRHNKLTALPPTLMHLRLLRVLDVEGNALAQVPPSLGWLSALEVANFRSNSIASPPPLCLADLPRLRDLDLTQQAGGDAVAGLPASKARGASMVAWLRDRLSDSEAGRVRVLFLGEKGCGKTSLIKALSSGKAAGSKQPLAERLPQPSQGVTRVELELPAHNLIITCWDFADELSWAANRAFFTNGTIFVVCFDLRHPDKANVAAWTSLVVSSAPLARILLVGTHLDDATCTKEHVEACRATLQTTLLDRTGNVRDLYTAASLTGKNIKELLNDGIVPAAFAVRAMQSGHGSGVGSRLIRNISTRFRRNSVIKRGSPSPPGQSPRRGSMDTSEGGDTSNSSPVRLSSFKRLVRRVSAVDVTRTCRAGSASSGSASPNPARSSPSDMSITSDSPNQVPSLPLIPLVAPSPQTLGGIPLSFVMFEEKLFALRQTMALPFMTWEQFELLAKHSGLPTPDQALGVAHYLQDLGLLLFFKDIVENTEVYRREAHREAASHAANLVVLDVEWVMRLFVDIVNWETEDGLILRRDLMVHWRQQRPELQRTVFTTIFWLLEHYEILFQVDDQFVFAPCTLCPLRPLLDMYWPHAIPSHQAQLSRNYNFAFLAVGFGSRLMAQLLRLGWHLRQAWATGILMEKSNELLLVEQSPALHVVRVSLRYPISSGRSTTFGPLLECLSTLINDWLHCNVVIEVPCMHCLREGSYDPYIFDLDGLASLMADGDYFAYCRSIHPVRIFSMAPDVSVEGVSSVIPYDQIAQGDKLGEGSFSIVYRGKWQGAEVAIKLMNLTAELDAGAKIRVFSEWRREVETMRSLVHPNIVGMSGVCLEPFCTVLEYCNAGDLFHHLHSSDEVVDWPFRLSVALDVAKGMMFLHSVTPPIIHRDLKSPNVMLHRSKETGLVTAKVGDFGLSVRLGIAVVVKGSLVDNPVWTAPEVMKGDSYNEKCDVYAFGVICWELVSRQQFFHDIAWTSEIEKRVLRGDRPPIAPECPETCANLIRACWAPESVTRPAFQRVCELLQQLSAELVAAGLLAEPPAAYSATTPPPSHRRSFNTAQPPINLRRTDVETRRAGALVQSNEKLVTVRQTPASIANASTRTGLPTPLLFDTQTNEERSFAFELDGLLSEMHSGPVECLLRVARAGALREDLLWSGDHTGCVFVSSVSTRTLVHRFQAHDAAVVAMVAMSGARVWTASMDGSVRIWEWAPDGLSIQMLKQVHKPSAKGTGVTCMVSEEETVFCGDSAGRIVAYSAPRFRKQVLTSVPAAVSCLCVAHGMLWIGVGNEIWCQSGDDAGSAFVLHGHAAPIHQIACVRNRVWSVSSDKTCCVWAMNGAEPRCMDILEGHSSRVFAVASDQEHYVWTAGWDKSIIAWTAQTQRFVKSMADCHEDAIAALLWWPPATLVSCSWDGRIALWKGPNGDPSTQPARLSESVHAHWGRASSTNTADALVRNLKKLDRRKSQVTLDSSPSPRSGSPRGVAIGAGVASPRSTSGGDLHKRRSRVALSTSNDGASSK